MMFFGKPTVHLAVIDTVDPICETGNCETVTYLVKYADCKNCLKLLHV